MLNAAQLLLRAGEPVLPLSRHVPFFMQRLVIEKAMARLFSQPLTEGEFDVLQGRWMRIEVTDLGLAWSLTRAGKGCGGQITSTPSRSPPWSFPETPGCRMTWSSTSALAGFRRQRSHHCQNIPTPRPKRRCR